MSERAAREVFYYALHHESCTVNRGTFDGKNDFVCVCGYIYFVLVHIFPFDI